MIHNVTLSKINKIMKKIIFFIKNYNYLSYL